MSERMQYELSPRDVVALASMGIADPPEERAAQDLRLAKLRARFCEDGMREWYDRCVEVRTELQHSERRRLANARWAAAGWSVVMGLIGWWATR